MKDQSLPQRRSVSATEGREEAAYFLGFLLAGCFGGSDRACSMPMSTHRQRSSSLVRSSWLTRSQPGISRPCITAVVAPVVAASPADRPGSTWTRTPPWPLALLHTLARRVADPAAETAHAQAAAEVGKGEAPGRRR